MSFQSDIYTYLTTHAGLSALVGDRIYPHGAGEPAAFPYIVQTIISGRPEYYMQPVGTTNEAGIENAIVSLDIWASTALSASNVEAQLRDALSGLSGVVGSTNIRRAFKRNQVGGTETPSDGKNDFLYRITTDYEFFFNS